jgi:hypothetical protein
MDGKEIYFEDKSGDKKYFTMLPNIVLNHSTANDQALYCQLKKHAGENGVCFVSERNLMLKLGIGDKALKTSFAYLLKRNWIKFEGLKDVMTSGGPQKVKSYSVVDIWNENISNYEGASKSDPLSAKVLSKEAKVLSEVTKGVRFQETNKNPIIKKEEDNTSLSENTNTEENQLTQEQIKERINKIRKEVVDKLKT